MRQSLREIVRQILHTKGHETPVERVIKELESQGVKYYRPTVS